MTPSPFELIVCYHFRHSDYKVWEKSEWEELHFLTLYRNECLRDMPLGTVSIYFTVWPDAEIEYTKFPLILSS